MLNRHWRRTRLVLSLLLAGSIVFTSRSVRRPVASAQAEPAYLDPVRAIELADYGISDPAGLAFSPAGNAFLVLEARNTPPATIVLITLTEEPAGAISFGTGIPDPLNMAFDAKASRLLAVDPVDRAA